MCDDDGREEREDTRGNCGSRKGGESLGCIPWQCRYHSPEGRVDKVGEGVRYEGWGCMFFTI